MRCDWQRKKFSEIAIFNPRESVRKGQLAKKVSIDKLRPFCRDVSEYTLEAFSGGTKFRNGDTIMARITPCLENGKTAQVSFLDEGEIGFGSTEYIVFRAIKEQCDEDFLYYLIRSPIVREPAIKSMSGSSGRQRVQTDVVQNLELSIPPLETQRKIASVLSSLDDKIELNNRINANLEEQARAIFKSWFVDFEPSGGKMPEDWRVASLLDIADYLNGLAMQNFRPEDGEDGLPVLKIKELRQGFCDDSSDLCSPSIKREYIISDGDVVFSWSGTLLVDLWCGGVCGLNQHLFKVTSKSYDKWFYLMWTNHHLQRFVAVAADKATTMGHIKRKELSDAKVLVPSKEDYQRLSSLLKPLYDLVISNRVENRRLSSLRDALLPRLLSGELDVSKLTL